MSKPEFGLGGQIKQELLNRFLNRGSAAAEVRSAPLAAHAEIPNAFACFERHPAYERLNLQQAAAERFGGGNPFFRLHDGVAGAVTRMRGEEYLNFSSYNYLGLAGDERVNQAAREAIAQYGTTASASRLVAGERPIQQALERALARWYGVDAALTFVSGHATNVSSIACLFGPKDLIVHDSLIHNSVIEGAKLSGAARRAFPHNDPEALARLLDECRSSFERVLIVIEGLYSMDGDLPCLQRFIELKQRYKAFLMVDEAHALGVLGTTGRGILEQAGLPGNAVDIWMGTLSKTLSSCGGYIAGSRPLIEILRYGAAGFVYSVGLPPPMAAAALEALNILEQEPWRVARLQDNGRLLLEEARLRGLDTGAAQGYSIMPLILGSSINAVRLSQRLLEQRINVQPIVYPAVEERSARLRFFVSADHTPEQIRYALDAVQSCS